MKITQNPMVKLLLARSKGLDGRTLHKELLKTYHLNLLHFDNPISSLVGLRCYFNVKE